MLLELSGTFLEYKERKIEKKNVRGKNDKQEI